MASSTSSPTSPVLPLPRGVESTIAFPLYNGAAAAVVRGFAASFAAGDIQISKDYGAFANVTNAPAEMTSNSPDEPGTDTGLYTLVLTAAEMTADVILVKLDDVAGAAFSFQLLRIDTTLNAMRGSGFSASTDTLEKLRDELTVMEGATFAAGTDTLEKIRDELTTMEGTGFATATDSLTELRDAFDDSVAPALPVTSISGLAGVGFLQRVVGNARRWVDEHALSSKFGNTVMLELVRQGWAEIVQEVMGFSETKIRCRHNITVVANQREYMLPPVMAAFLELAKLDTDGEMLWEVVPEHPLNPWGPGFTIEGTVLRFEPIWKVGETLRITYLPNGELPIHEGTGKMISSTVAEFASSPTVGTRDTRPNAYAGYMLRIISATYTGQTEVPVAEVPIASYNNLTRRATLMVAPVTVPDLNPTTMVYEVVPFHAYLFEPLLAYWIGRHVAVTAPDKDRAKLLGDKYNETLRAIRSQAAQFNQRTGTKFQRRSR